MRQMVMVGFLQAQNCTNLVSSWRHPDSRSDSTSADYYQTIGRVLEEGKFHVGFFDDRLAMPDRYGNDHRHTVEHGIRCVKMDPVTVLTVMGMATKRLGLGATRSTTYYEPFDVARTFATLDLMTDGRAAWNVVTSMNDGEALNMGKDEHQEHDSRYDRADEFMKVVVGHWNSWDDDAIVQDKKTGVFAHPDKVSRLDHKGEWFKSRGPFTVPRSKQGHPVIIQAGQSGRGKQFSARWGELVFVSTPVNLDVGRQNYREMKAEVERLGRDPSHLSVTPSAYVVCAETKMEAEDKMALIETLATDEDALSLLSEAMNFDFASKGLDEPFSDEELDNISGTQSMRDRVVKASGIRNPTPRDFVKYSHRARPNLPFIGGPKEVADGLEEWFSTGVCDGFVIAATHVPGTYMEFVKHVVPELQRRGLYHKDYTGATLRENLGDSYSAQERDMKLGLSIGYSKAKLDLPVALVQRAEELGYDSVWSAEAYGTDAVTPLAFLAAVTKRIRLGTGIMQLAARTPANAAMCAGTVDALAGGGRFIAGLGVSGPQIVEGWYGQPWGRPYYRLKDYVAIMRKIFAREEPVTHDGREIPLPYTGDGASGVGKPLKSILHMNPEIPIYLATGSESTVKLTAEVADGWLPMGFVPGCMEEYGPWLQEGFRRAGNGKSLKDFHIQASIHVEVADDVKGALAKLKPEVALYVGGMGHKDKNFHKEQMIRRGFAEAADRIHELYLAHRKDEAIAAVPDEWVDMKSLVGPPARIRERFRAWEDSGATSLTVRSRQPEAIEVMAQAARLN